MAGYLLTKRARRDILEVWQYIARDSESHADKFLANLIEQFSILGQNPRAGRERNDIRPGIRGFPFGQYEILYRIEDPGVRISDVIHGRRDLRKMRRR
jgi:toxin ParE1/3/4